MTTYRSWAPELQVSTCCFLTDILVLSEWKWIPLTLANRNTKTLLFLIHNPSPHTHNAKLLRGNLNSPSYRTLGLYNIHGDHRGTYTQDMNYAAFMRLRNFRDCPCWRSHSLVARWEHGGTPPRQRATAWAGWLWPKCFIIYSTVPLPVGCFVSLV